MKFTVTVDKASSVITSKKKSFSLKAKKLKKKAQTVSFTAKSSSGGKITYSGKAYGKSKKVLKFKGGKITVKKGTKKGTYKMTVTVKAAKTAEYNAFSKKVAVTVTVK